MASKNTRITLNIEPREDGGFYVDSDDMPELIAKRKNIRYLPGRRS